MHLFHCKQKCFNNYCCELGIKKKSMSPSVADLIASLTIYLVHVMSCTSLRISGVESILYLKTKFKNLHPFYFYIFVMCR